MSSPQSTAARRQSLRPVSYAEHDGSSSDEARPTCTSTRRQSLRVQAACYEENGGSDSSDDDEMKVSRVVKAPPNVVKATPRCGVAKDSFVGGQHLLIREHGGAQPAWGTVTDVGTKDILVQWLDDSWEDSGFKLKELAVRVEAIGTYDNTLPPGRPCPMEIEPKTKPAASWHACGGGTPSRAPVVTPTRPRTASAAARASCNHLERMTTPSGHSSKRPRVKTEPCESPPTVKRLRNQSPPLQEPCKRRQVQTEDGLKQMLVKWEGYVEVERQKLREVLEKQTKALRKVKQKVHAAERQRILKIGKQQQAVNDSTARYNDYLSQYKDLKLQEHMTQQTHHSQRTQHSQMTHHSQRTQHSQIIAASRHSLDADADENDDDESNEGEGEGEEGEGEGEEGLGLSRLRCTLTPCDTPATSPQTLLSHSSPQTPSASSSSLTPMVALAVSAAAPGTRLPAAAWKGKCNKWKGGAKTAKRIKALDPNPKDFECPITCDIMVDPVVAKDGFTYERNAIERWFRLNTTSPFKGNQIRTTLTPNHNLKSRIESWRAELAHDLSGE